MLSRKRAVLATCVLAFLAALPLLLHGLRLPIRFNQFMIQELEQTDSTRATPALWRRLRSAYSSGLNILRRWPSATPPSFDDELAMFRHIWSWLPTVAWVYPTEGFYYFNFPMEEHSVWGNVRIAAADSGEIGIAYFKRPGNEVRILKLHYEDGVRVRKHNDFRYDVTFEGKTVAFHMNEINESAPEAPLRANEEAIGRIHDEAGVRLHLLFNHETDSFYYVLDETYLLSDTLRPVGDHVLLSERTGFLYYDEEAASRKVLVGVAHSNVKENNFYDGPGDQVPFRMNLKRKMQRAYKNCLRENGIDTHGVYRKADHWSRLAICPYVIYKSVADVRHLVEDAQKKVQETGRPDYLATALTKEWWNNSFWNKQMGKKVAELGKYPPRRERGTTASAVDASMPHEFMFEADPTYGY